jgi:hypothetical protein
MWEAQQIEDIEVPNFPIKNGNHRDSGLAFPTEIGYPLQLGYYTEQCGFILLIGWHGLRQWIIPARPHNVQYLEQSLGKLLSELSGISCCVWVYEPNLHHTDCTVPTKGYNQVINYARYIWN